jgi:phosphate transport system permease protein
VADNDTSMLVGYSDGSVRPITLTISVDFIKLADLDPALTEVAQSGFQLDNGIIYRLMPSGLVRKQILKNATFHPTIAVSKDPIVCVDWKTPQAASSFDESQMWCWAASDGKSITMGTIDNRINSFSGSITHEIKTWNSYASDLPDDELTIQDKPVLSLMIGARSDNVTVLDRNGNLIVWNQTANDALVPGISHTSLAGTESVASMGVPLLGRTTILIGSQSGHIEGVSMTSTPTGTELMSIHRFPVNDSAIRAIDASPEGRLVVSQSDNQIGSLYYVPTNRKLLEWSTEIKRDSPPTIITATRDPARGRVRTPRLGNVFFSANASCIGCVSGSKVALWKIHVPFPEASLGSFFSPIWYEGYRTPQHVWQSSTGNVEGEYKFGFMPLVFGTLKATFYSMLIGAPIALMAAIFGSEFMSSRWRARVKPVIELMASVPSVVLGFIGALVLAPILRENLMMCLLSVVMILFLFLLAAHLWLIIPSTIAIRLRRLRLPVMFALIPIGLAISYRWAGFFEQFLFKGNVIQWLSAATGSGWSGWFCLMVFPMSILVAWIVSAPLSPYVQVYARKLSPFQFSLVNLGIFALSALVVLCLCAVVASSLSMVGVDPRGSVLGPYQERNALLVGAILSFAIIPLIYTISEDALQSVPQHLRSASLGCGATIWQTTIRVVVPTAMSGLFSALMIGFGRAVGETMVVLMAAGNTPVMDINPMNGYRTLSATLATELPEAARGSTHFHALFLAAFLLFCFTMVANTIAEMVRMRFRKRAFQL